MRKSKSKFLIPAVGAASVVIVGGLAAYMYLKQGPAGDISGALESAKIVPNEAIMATYISTEPTVWAKLQQFDTTAAEKLLAKSLNNLNQGSLSYEQDLKPWVGSIMIALLPENPVKGVQNPPQSVQHQNNILMVVGIKDKLSAVNFANKIKSQKSVTTPETEYKGEKIAESTDNNTFRYSTILNNSYLVLSPEKQAIEHAIDAYKGEPSFASKEGVKRLLTTGVNVENPLAQIYVPDYASMVQNLSGTNTNATHLLSPQTLAQSKQLKSIVAGVGVDQLGIRVKAIANLDPQLVTYQPQNSTSQVVSQLPSDTIALINGQGISSWWPTFVEQSKNNPEFNQALQQIREQLKSVNIDLDQEVFGWMNGEFAAAAIPSNQGVLAPIGFGGALVFHTSDHQTAENTLTKLDNLAKKQLFSIAQTNIGGKNITEWQIPQQGALLAHGWLDQDTVFVAIGGPVAGAIAQPQGQSLENSENFKAVTSSLEKPNGGYLYLDMDKTMSLLGRFAAPQQQSLSPETTAILNSIQSLGVTTTSLDKSTSQMEMLMSLKPKSRN